MHCINRLCPRDLISPNVPVPHADLAGLSRQPQPLFVFSQSVLRSRALYADGDLIANSESDIKFVLGKCMRLIIIDHEFADEHIIIKQRYKRESPDTLALDH